MMKAPAPQSTTEAPAPSSSKEMPLPYFLVPSGSDGYNGGSMGQAAWQALHSTAAATDPPAAWKAQDTESESAWQEEQKDSFTTSPVQPSSWVAHLQEDYAEKTEQKPAPKKSAAPSTTTSVTTTVTTTSETFTSTTDTWTWTSTTTAQAPIPQTGSLLVLPQPRLPPQKKREWWKPVPENERTTIGVSIVQYGLKPTLFCYAVALEGTVEPWLMVVHSKRRTGIFGCHRYAFYSDNNLTLGVGPWGAVEAVPIPGKPAWHAPVPGSDELVWHNTGVFARAWIEMQADGTYRDYDWTIKVDPDTAFFPGLLQTKLAETQKAQGFKPEDPVYFKNCQRWYSFQGPLEVFSKGAAEKFFPQMDKCMSNLNWQDWGEDWFVGKCLDMLGVAMHEGFDLLDDYWCNHETVSCSAGKPAFHPQKSTDDLETCFKEVLPSYLFEQDDTI